MTDDRYDIELGEYLRGLLHWWWLVVALAVLGAVLGAGLTLAQHKTYVAAASVYLGQPTDASGASISALNTDPRAAAAIGESDSTIRLVVGQIGMGETAGRLRAGLTIQAPPAAVKSAVAPINVTTISVTDVRRARAVAAANAIAAVVVQKLAVYNTAKIALLTAQVTADDRRIAQLQSASDTARRALAAIAAGGGSADTRAMASAPYLAISQSASSELQTLLDDRRTDGLTLLVARNVEQPSIIARAALPSLPQARPLRLDTAAGLAVGIVVGLIAAAALEWRRRERRGAVAA